MGCRLMLSGQRSIHAEAAFVFGYQTQFQVLSLLAVLFLAALVHLEHAFCTLPVFFRVDILHEVSWYLYAQ